MSRVALVIGGTGGLGAGCAEDLAKDHTVIVAGRNETKGKAIVDKITSAGGKAAFASVDIMEEASILSLHKEVLDKYGRLDTAVNAAGVLPPFEKLADSNKERWDRCMTINTTGVFLSMKEQILAMQKNAPEKGGVIVNLSSIYGLTGCKWGSPYCILCPSDGSSARLPSDMSSITNTSQLHQSTPSSASPAPLPTSTLKIISASTPSPRESFQLK